MQCAMSVELNVQNSNSKYAIFNFCWINCSKLNVSTCQSTMTRARTGCAVLVILPLLQKPPLTQLRTPPAPFPPPLKDSNQTFKLQTYSHVWTNFANLLNWSSAPAHMIPPSLQCLQLHHLHLFPHLNIQMQCCLGPQHPLVGAHMIPPSLPAWQFDIPPPVWSMIATNLLEPILIHCSDFWLCERKCMWVNKDKVSCWHVWPSSTIQLLAWGQYQL